MIDFGLAACVRDGRKLKVQCGTPAFAAPEVWKMKPYSTPADVWSCGVMVFVMTVGQVCAMRGAPVTTVASMRHFSQLGACLHYAVSVVGGGFRGATALLRACVGN